MSKHMSIKEVAEALRIDYSTARKWVISGDLPGEKIANRVFAIREEIEKIAEMLEGTVSIQEAAKRINRAGRTVYWLITVEKKIEGFVWMRRWHVYEDSIDAYLEERGPDPRLKPKGYR